MLKFYYQHENKNLPIYFQNIEYNPSMSLHHYNTRKHEYVYYVKHEFAKKSLKYTIPKLLNETPTFIKDKVHTHSLNHTLKTITSAVIHLNAHLLKAATFVKIICIN